MEKIWLKEYPKGVPAEIDRNQYASLKAIFEDSCRRYAGLPAYSNLGATLDYANLERLSRRFGAYRLIVVGRAHAGQGNLCVQFDHRRVAGGRHRALEVRRRLSNTRCTDLGKRA